MRRPGSRTGAGIRFAAVIATLSFIGASEAQEGRLIDRVVAVVNNEVITLGQLDRGVQRVLDDIDAAACVAGRVGDPLAQAPRAEIERQTLECMIDDLLMFQHVRRFPQFDVLETDLDAAFRDVVESFPSRQAFEQELARQRLTAAELRYDLEREALVQNYIGARYVAMVDVTLPDMQRYYDEVLAPEMEREAAPMPAFEGVAGMIESILVAIEVEQRVGDWIADLRRRAAIIVYVW